MYLGWEFTAMGVALALFYAAQASEAQVAARARVANNAIASRFEELAHQQLEQTTAWLARQAPPTKEIEKIAAIADKVSDSLQNHAPSPGQGEGRGEGRSAGQPEASARKQTSAESQSFDPHPTPLPARERGPEQYRANE